MVLKTFNLEEKTYKKFSEFCKDKGISMSKQVQIFIGSVIEEDPKIRKEYLKKLESIKHAKYGGFNNIHELRNLIENE